jgi:hypothetical protein
MKAIIGYGDALLFSLGEYHWSYVERQRRAKLRGDIHEAFRTLYDEAAEFRFQPNYEEYLKRDLQTWMTEIRYILEPVHRTCEAHRLGVSSLSWSGYLDLALRHAITDELLSARAWARKGVQLTRRTNLPSDMRARSRLGCKVMGTKDQSTLVFPLLAYNLDEPTLQAFAVAALNQPDGASTDSLRDAYIRLWCEAIDINALSELRPWHVPVARESGERCS